MNNSNGFQTKVWGPAAWLFLHCITLNYNPKRDKKQYKLFFEMLAYVLPCKACRDNYKDTIQGNETSRNRQDLRLTSNVFKSRRTLSVWLFKLHIYVTKCQLKLKQGPYENTSTDFNKMVAFYEQFRAKCTKPPSSEGGEHSGGCTLPAHKGGLRMRSVIHIKPFTKKTLSRSIIVKQ